MGGNEGAYGSVEFYGKHAIKRFKSNTTKEHIIREVAALMYTAACPYIVKIHDFDLYDNTIVMQRYDTDLKEWLSRNSYSSSSDKKVIIIKNILLGLIFLHERGLVHGDLKPNNILVQHSPFHVVLGDCGFVSISKYARVDLTARAYKELNVSHAPEHDMFSFGVCLIEILTGKRSQRTDYDSLYMYVNNCDGISSKFKHIIKRLITEDKSHRLTAKQCYAMIFGETSGNASKFVSPAIVKNINKNNKFYSIFYDLNFRYKINRSKKCYGALHNMFKSTNLSHKECLLYSCAALVIVGSCFGGEHARYPFRIRDALNEYPSSIGSEDALIRKIDELLRNKNFLKVIFYL